VLALLSHLSSPALLLFVCTLRHYRVHCASARSFSRTRCAWARLACAYASHGRIRNRKRASAKTNPQRTSSPRPLLLSSTLAATSTAFRSGDYLSFPPFRLQPSSRRIASRSIFRTLRTWRAPRGPVILMVSRMLLFIQCRVREALAGSFVGLRDTRQKSHENHFNSRRASTYPAGDKARERIIADECFRE